MTPAGAWIAALPMYDLNVDAVRAATDAWWAGIARHLRAAGVRGVPDALTRPAEPAAVWDDARLLLGQGCGYPLRTAYPETWHVVATPCYAAPGCAGPHYSSRVVVPADSPATGLGDLVGRVAAVNEAASHSGHIALRAAMAPDAGDRPAFRAVRWTGGHAASIRAVAEGRADVCAVDCVTHALLARHAPHRLSDTRVLTATPRAPALPYIAGPRVDGDTLTRVRAALAEAVADPDLEPARAALLLADIVVLPASAYARIDELAASGEPAAFV